MDSPADVDAYLLSNPQTVLAAVHITVHNDTQLSYVLQTNYSGQVGRMRHAWGSGGTRKKLHFSVHESLY